ncbi:MAG: cupin domain-containing protein [Ignavibacteria bacterium]|nr:cupin domain-containing protein [Ignavibacteria bacterium]
MKNNNQIREENIILRSLGLYNDEGNSQTEKNEDPEYDNVIKDYSEVASMLPSVLYDSKYKKSLSPNAKNKILDNILNEIDEKSKAEKKDINFSFVLEETSEWKEYPVKGIKYKPLSFNKEKNYIMLLLKAEAGCQYPSHHHSGAEECYVIEGDLHAEGKILGPGDFHHAEGDSDHKSLYTENGCTLIIVADPEDYS